MVSLAPSCTAPASIAPADVQGNQATISWTDHNATAGTYKLTWGANDSLVTTDTFHVLNNLMPNTTYTVSVSKLCDDAWTESRSTTFTTPCATVTLPYVESFESAPDNGQFMPCWNRLNPISNYSSVMPYVYTYSYYAHSGSKLLYFDNSYYASNKPVIVLPEMPDSLSRLEFSMWIEFYYSGSIEMGYVTDPDDANTFVAVATASNNSYSDDYEFFSTTFPANATGRIAFRYASGTYNFIDDIEVVRLVSCPKPVAVSAVPDSTSATIAINDTANTGHYRVIYGTARTSDTVVITSNTHLLPNLLPNTDYTVKVASICSDGETRYTETTFHTLCSQVSLPYANDFETGSNQAMPECWVQLTDANVTGGSYAYNSYTINGSRSFYMATKKDQTNMAAMPLFEGSLASAGMIYSVRARANANCGTFMVGYLTGTDTSTFVALRTYANNDSTVYGVTSTPRNDTVYFTGAPAGSRIAFKHVGGSSSNNYGWSVDDVYVQTVGNCAMPTATLSATPGNVMLTISNHEQGSRYAIALYGADTIMADTIAAATHTFGGLVEGATYGFFMQRICSDGNATLPVRATVFVPCTAITHAEMPFTEDFDSYAEYYQMAGCWTTISNNTYPEVYTYASYAHSGRKTLYFYGGTNSNVQMVVLPEMDNVNDLELRFWSRGESNIVVGVMTNPDSINTFVATDTIASTSSMAQRAGRFASYTGAGRYIALRQVGSSNYTGVYIDDIYVNVAPDCAEPQGVSIDTAGADMIAFTIADSNNANNYRITCTSEYGTDTLLTTSKQDTLRNLRPGTVYQMDFEVICPNGLSPLAIGMTQQTACATITHNDLPLIMAFNQPNLTTCWGVRRMADNSYGYPDNTYDHTGNGGYAFRYYRYYTAGTYQTLGSPEFDNLTDLMVNFWGRFVYTGDTLFVATYSGDIDTATLHIHDTIVSTNTSTWNEYEVRLAAAGTDNRIAIKGVPSGNYNGFHIDDITVTLAPNCVRAESVAISDISATSATVTVNDPTYVGNYYIYASSAYGTDTIHVENGSTATLTDLAPGTNYNVSVATLCSDGNLTSKVNTSFVTACAPINALPWHEDFENMYTESRQQSDYYGYVPNCWNLIYGSGSTWNVGASSSQYLYSYPYYTSANGSRFYCYQLAATTASYYNDDNVSVLTLPEFGLPMRQLQVTSRAGMPWDINGGTYDENTGVLEVGVITNPADGATFVPYDTLPYAYSNSANNYAYGEHVTDFANYNGPEGRIAYRFTYNQEANYWHVFIYDIVVDAPNACAAPAVVSSSATDVTATVDYTAAADSIEVAYTLGQWDEPTATAGFHNDGTFTLHGLTPDTTYTVGLRAVCEEGNSLWTLTTLRTAPVVCNATSAPTIEATSFNSVSVSWTAASAETAWLVRVYNNTFDRTDTARTTTATIDGLTAGVAYQVTVQPLCGSDQSVEGPVSEATPFNTDVCQPVSGVSVSNVTAHTAQISWTNGNNGNGTWIVEYGDAGYAQGQGTQVVANTNPFTLTGLEADYVYDVYVRTVCTDDLSSNWAAGGQIATLEAGQGQTYTVSLDVNDPAMGTVTGAGEYEEGSVAVLTATANTGYVFVKWSDENSDNPRRLAVTANISLTAIFATDTTGIGEVAGSSIALYPNPATTTVTVDLGSAEATGATVSVIDLNGREVLRTAATDSRVSLDVSRLAQGAYFVKVTGEHVNAIRKLVVR